MYIIVMRLPPYPPHSPLLLLCLSDALPQRGGWHTGDRPPGLASTTALTSVLFAVTQSNQPDESDEWSDGWSGEQPDEQSKEQSCESEERSDESDKQSKDWSDK